MTQVTQRRDALWTTGCEDDMIRALGKCEWICREAGISWLTAAHLPELWQREAMIVFGVKAPHEKAYVRFLSGKAKVR